MTEPTTSTTFVSYKREDRARVAPLVEGLRTARLKVWWDADIPGGVDWRPTILEHLEASSCVIVVWSAGSVSEAGGFVHEEAARAKARGTLLPVRLDAVAPPLGFGEIQSLDLIGWSGRSDDPRVADIADAARALVQGGPRPRPRAVTLSQWTLGAFVASALAGLGFFADVASLQHTVCHVTGVRYACAKLGLGGIPSATEQAMWDARPPGDCEWLRGFLVRFPAGAHTDEAGRRLQALRRTTEETWRPETRPVPLFVGSPERPASTEDAARADALSRGAKGAELACAGYTAGSYRLRSAIVDTASLEWRCAGHTDGVRCSFDGRARCEVDVRQTLNHEVCE